MTAAAALAPPPAAVAVVDGAVPLLELARTIHGLPAVGGNRVELLGENAWRLYFNPFYPMLEVIRGPLVEGGVGLDVWIAAAIYTALLTGAALTFFIRFRSRVAFWV